MSYESLDKEKSFLRAGQQLRESALALISVIFSRESDEKINCYENIVSF